MSCSHPRKLGVVVALVGHQALSELKTELPQLWQESSAIRDAFEMKVEAHSACNLADLQRPPQL
eukprot:1215909-Amphidinium_carterae.1